MVEQAGVEEVECGPHVLLQSDQLVQETISENMERDPGDVETQHQQRELLTLGA